MWLVNDEVVDDVRELAVGRFEARPSLVLSFFSLVRPYFRKRAVDLLQGTGTIGALYTLPQGWLRDFEIIGQLAVGMEEVDGKPCAKIYATYASPGGVCVSMLHEHGRPLADVVFFDGVAEIPPWVEYDDDACLMETYVNESERLGVTVTQSYLALFKVDARPRLYAEYGNSPAVSSLVSREWEQLLSVWELASLSVTQGDDGLVRVFKKEKTTPFFSPRLTFRELVDCQFADQEPSIQLASTHPVDGYSLFFERGERLAIKQQCGDSLTVGSLLDRIICMPERVFSDVPVAVRVVMEAGRERVLVLERVSGGGVKGKRGIVKLLSTVSRAAVFMPGSDPGRADRLLQHANGYCYEVILRAENRESFRRKHGTFVRADVLVKALAALDLSVFTKKRLKFTVKACAGLDWVHVCEASDGVLGKNDVINVLDGFGENAYVGGRPDNFAPAALRLSALARGGPDPVHVVYCNAHWGRGLNYHRPDIEPFDRAFQVDVTVDGWARYVYVNRTSDRIAMFISKDLRICSKTGLRILPSASETCMVVEPGGSFYIESSLGIPREEIDELLGDSCWSSRLQSEYGTDDTMSLTVVPLVGAVGAAWDNGVYSMVGDSCDVRFAKTADFYFRRLHDAVSSDIPCTFTVTEVTDPLDDWKGTAIYRFQHNAFRGSGNLYSDELITYGVVVYGSVRTSEAAEVVFAGCISLTDSDASFAVFKSTGLTIQVNRGEPVCVSVRAAIVCDDYCFDDGGPSGCVSPLVDH